MEVVVQNEELEGYAKARKLHEQLERSGAYEKIRNRRGAQLLRAYLPTQDSISEANKTLERPYNSEGAANMAVHRAMQKAFTFLG